MQSILRSTSLTFPNIDNTFSSYVSLILLFKNEVQFAFSLIIKRSKTLVKDIYD